MGLSRAALPLALAALAACSRDPERAATASGTGFMNQAKDVAYLGSEACRPCHAERWSTFSHTGMGRSWYPLTANNVIEDWTTHNTVDVPWSKLRYTMTRRDGKFFMRQALLTVKGEETAVDERELTRIIGSGNHSRTYLVTMGSKMFQAPVCWYTQDKVWDLCPGYEQNNDHFTREIDRTCVFCHNARMQRVPNQRNVFVEPIPDGIDCERCHGPGKLHVERQARGDTPTGEGDRTIVNPRRLPSELRIQVCFQCHLGDSKSTERVARVEMPLEDWRPGQPITAAIVPFRFADATPHDFGLSAQVDRLLLSRCYTESKGRIECLTCHDPHVTVFRANRPADFFTSKCLGCHGLDACTAPVASRRQTSPPDDCVACHMRKAEPSDHAHASFTDHWIRRRIDEPAVPRKSLGVTPYLPEHFAQLPSSEQAFYTGRAISLRAPSVPARLQRGMWPQAERAFRESIALGFADPDAWFFLGKTLTNQGKHREAAAAYATAHEKDPSGHDAAFAHGQALLSQGRLDDAERVFEAMTREHSESAAPFAELGRCRAQRGDFTGALRFFQQALEREPWNASLHENTAMVLSALDRHRDALATGAEAIRLDPESVRIRESLATLKARAAASR